MSVSDLRQLGLTLKSIYRLDAFELRSVVKKAASTQIKDRRIWNALLYRATVLRSELKPIDLAVTINALVRIRFQDENVYQYLLAEARKKVHRFFVYDAALLLNALAKQMVRDDPLMQSLLPPLLRRLTERTRPDHFALLALAYARLQDPGRAPVNDRIVAALTPRLDLLEDGHTLSLLAYAFAQPALHSEQQKLEGKLDYTSPSAEDVRGSHLATSGHLSHIYFLEVLFDQCNRHLWEFKSTDILHMCLALSTVVRAGHKDLVPPRMMKRIVRRVMSLYFEFSSAQLVRLLELTRHLPELERGCGHRLVEELTYRVRDLTPASCLSVLQSLHRFDDNAQAISAMCWRLSRPDAGTLLAPHQLNKAATAIAAFGIKSWEARETLLSLLQAMHRRRVVPMPKALSQLLYTYGELAVRDTHWVHLCGGLSKNLDEEAIGNAALALARLSFPHVVDSAKIFTRAESTIKSPRPAAALLEAASIFEFVGREPRDLIIADLQPIVEAASSSGTDTPPWLFPFTDAAAQFCCPNLAATWQQAATRTATEAAKSAEESADKKSDDEFHQSVRFELDDMPNLVTVERFVVGPLVVPWAVDCASIVLAATPSLPASVLPRSREDVRDEHEKRSEHEMEEETGAATKDYRLRGRKSQRRRGGFFGDKSDTLLIDGDAGDGDDDEQEGHRSRLRQNSRPKIHWSSSDSDSDQEDGYLQNVEASDQWRGRWIRPGDAQADCLRGISPLPETHILLDLLREQDFYHASDRIRAEQQRAKTQVLSTARFAELSFLRRKGWNVCCIKEHTWNQDTEGKPKRDYLLKLLADAVRRGSYALK